MASQDEFVRFWSDQYAYTLEHLYEQNIGKPLNAGRVLELYRWKNGNKRIAEKKLKSIAATYISQLAKIPNLKSAHEGSRYLSRLGGGAVWSIFWLHCLQPEIFPIFDQHTYRAMAKINDSSMPPELPKLRKRRVEIYFSTYIPFTLRFPASLRRPRRGRLLDKALFAYGRFLKNGFSGEYIYPPTQATA